MTYQQEIANNMLIIVYHCISINFKCLFLDRVPTEDKKWILYTNSKRRYQWLRYGGMPTQQPRVGLYSRKILLSLWQDMQEIIYYKLLNDNQTITAKVCQQLRCLKAPLDTKKNVHL